MEISRTVPKRSIPSNSHGDFASHKSDIFGGQQKAGIPALAPCREDYYEIFGGFHASRTSSIPVLHIPILDAESGIQFDVRSPGLDYAEVFGNAGGSSFTASFEDVFRSDQSWIPLQSGSMSDELDPAAESHKSNMFLDGDARRPIGRSEQFSVSHSKPYGRNMDAVSGGPISLNEEDQTCIMPVASSVNFIKASSGSLKNSEKHLQDRLHCSTSQRRETDSKSFGKPGNSTSMLNKPFITISDVNLRTKPSELPPPSRPPPVFLVKKRECGRSDTQGTADGTFAIEMPVDGDEMAFFDVEVDEGCKRKGNEWVKFVDAKSVEGKTFLDSNMQMDQKSSSPARGTGSEHVEILHSRVQEATISEPFMKGWPSSRRSLPGTTCRHGHINDSSADSVTWREMEEYFEVTENRKFKHPITVKDLGESCSQDPCLTQKETNIQSYSPSEEVKDFNWTNDAPRYDKKANQPEFVKEPLVWGSSPPKRTIEKNPTIEEARALVTAHDKLEVQEGFLNGPMAECHGGSEGLGKVQANRVRKDEEFQRNEKPQGGPSVKENRTKQIFCDEKNDRFFMLADGRRLPCIGMRHKGSRAAQCDSESEEKGRLGNAGEEKVGELTFSWTLEQVGNAEEDILLEKDEFIDRTGNPWKAGGHQQAFFEAKETSNFCGDVCVQRELHDPPEENVSLQMSGHDTELNKSLGKDKATFSPVGNMELNSEHDRKDGVSLPKVDKPQNLDSYVITRKTLGSSCLPEPPSIICGSGMMDSNTLKDKISPTTQSSIEQQKIYYDEDHDVRKTERVQLLIKKIDIKESYYPRQVMKECRANEKGREDAPLVLGDNDSKTCSVKTMSQRIERKDRNIDDTIVAGGLDARRPMRGESDVLDDCKRNIEEGKEREREREKDLMAVDKSALDVRARPYSDFHDKMALHRTSVEMRQKISSPVGVDKIYVDESVRSERVAVERATHEAWWRASGKFISGKPSDAQGHLEISFSDKQNSKTGDSGCSSLPSELQFNNVGDWGSSQHTFPSVNGGTDGESLQRHKAQLERYRRTEDRMENALAEKNRRDLLAQREKEERNKVAEALDAEVKRWSNGKEGNLRALLSTLQYILGPESGWQPIPLTEVITPVAVKKAYRKATLCVHPDKLQQRGATVQQKYICEKVFDLLKEAWNKFNSMEY